MMIFFKIEFWRKVMIKDCDDEICDENLLWNLPHVSVGIIGHFKKQNPRPNDWNNSLLTKKPSMTMNDSKTDFDELWWSDMNQQIYDMREI